MELDKLIAETYQNPSDPGSFGGEQRLHASLKEKGITVSRQKIKNFLRGHPAYTLHKPARRIFKRNPTIVSGIDAQWQADLVDVSDLANQNKQFKFLLTVIDCFSKYAWAIPLKDKSAQSIIDAFKLIFKSKSPMKKRKPKKLQTDKGKEFLNSAFQKFLRSNNIKHFTTENTETKAAQVERFNRTLKTKMWTYFTHKNTRKYLDILEPLLNSYNNSIHRSIKMKPAEVKSSNEKEIFHRLYGSALARSKLPAPSNRARDKPVRISKIKTTFEKGYLPNWTKEVFLVKKHMKKNPKGVYKLRDIQGEEIAGTFYPEEIQQINQKKDDIIPVEKILRTSYQNKKKKYLVKFLGQPSKFNSWIAEEELHKING